MVGTTTSPNKPKRRRKGTLVRFVLDKSIPPLLWLWFTLTWPFWILQVGFFWLVGAVQHWWATRSFWLLLAGLPALLIIVLSGYMIVAISLQDPRQLVERYRKAAKNAMTAEKYADAKVYLERVLEFQRGDRDALFDLAKAAANTNDAPRAASAMLVLAPEDHPVYGPAHLWQAIRLLSHKPISLKEVRLAEIHLKHSLLLNESTETAHEVLGEIYWQQRLWNQAIPHLLYSSKRIRSHALKLARAYSNAGEEEKGRQYAEEAREYFAKQINEGSRDWQHRMALADALLFLKRYPDAIQVLKELASWQDEPSVHQALAKVYLAWSDSIPGNSFERNQQQFELLAAGIQEYPDDLTFFDRIMRLVESDTKNEEFARKLLTANLVDGRSLGLSHLLIGSLDYKAGKSHEAAKHLERAFEILPKAEIVGNNLAWLLLHSDPPQAERALELVDSCIQRAPSVARFRDTRGLAYLKLGRYREAADDLEMALQVLRNEPATHRALADAYKHLELYDLASAHEARANELTGSARK